MSGRYYVGEWLVEPEQSRVVRGTESAKLDPKAVQVLSFLAEHPNDVLSKEQIIGSVWDGAFVSDEVLTTAIWGLRKALGDDAKEPSYIQTIPRKGYRLIAPVERATAEASRRWEPSPYPGLSAFSQRDAEYFFGREAEVEALWTKLQERTLLGLIGPSGAGKSSLLRAGLIPACPEGWGIHLCQPRNDPFRSFEGIDAWRAEYSETLVIVDQFEELFTLNDGETQGRFAELLSGFSKSGVHVLLSMRDDFLIRCHTLPALAPVFEKLTPVLPLEGAALRSALTEPARASGYQFEDEALISEILTEVSRERGALPLLAFAASKLWEMRDRERRRLTRAAYLSIGGVAGALAKHAEETLSAIGAEQEPLVREVFRNLVSGQATRVPTERDELLTVFPDRDAAANVLGKLIDARLLTSAGDQVEIIHESLLTEWPRLVRWQAQDAEGSVLRDQLRHAARVWQERGRPEDLLWTGTSFREMSLWRERYPGGLTSIEEEFTAASTKLAGRKRRRRQLAMASVVVILLAVIAAITLSRRQALRAALRAESSKVLALGQLELETNPTAALAYAIKSLELSDTEEARRFALRVLTEAPTAMIQITEQQDGLEAHRLAFTPSGEWLAVGGYRKAQLLSRDGGEPRFLEGEYPSGGFRAVHVGFSERGDILVTNQGGEVRLWDVPGGRELLRKRTLEQGFSSLFPRRDGYFTSTSIEDREVIRWWPLQEGESQLVGEANALNEVQSSIDSEGTRIAYPVGQTVHLRSLQNWDAPPRVLKHLGEVGGVAFHPDGKTLAASDDSGQIRLWTTGGTTDSPTRVLEAEGARDLSYSPGGKWLAAMRREEDGRLEVSVWDLTAPPGTRPIRLSNDWLFMNDLMFDPSERWIATANVIRVALWPLGGDYPRILEGHEGNIQTIAFTPDGETLLSASGDGTVRAWPLRAGAGESRVLFRAPMTFPGLAMNPAGTEVAVSGAEGRVYVVPVDGGAPRELMGFSNLTEIQAIGFSPDGKRVAAAPTQGPAEEKVLRIWDLETGAMRVVGPAPGAAEGAQGAIFRLSYFGENEILATGWPGGLLSFDPRGGEAKVLFEKPNGSFAVSRSRVFGFGTYEFDGVFRFEFDGAAPPALITTHGTDYLMAVALNSTETLMASGDERGLVRIGPVSGGEPYLFFGHEGIVRVVAFSPDGKWLASAGNDRTIRLWPVPDVTKTPPHKRSHEEFLAMLRSWTNLRLVPDEQASTGWRTEVGAFPGWAKLPERWQ